MRMQNQSKLTAGAHREHTVKHEQVSELICDSYIMDDVKLAQLARARDC